MNQEIIARLEALKESKPTDMHKMRKTPYFVGLQDGFRRGVQESIETIEELLAIYDTRIT